MSSVEDILVAVARTVQSRAYAPYSNYRVGAALMTRSGKLFHGCNVENATYGATICAERSAIVAMIAAGESDPYACAIYTNGDTPAAPCGICRQVLAEFARDMKLTLVAASPRGEVRKRVALAKLLPNSFGPEALGVQHPAARKPVESPAPAPASAKKARAKQQDGRPAASKAAPAPKVEAVVRRVVKRHKPKRVPPSME
jgi:cytidine deaminase